MPFFSKISSFALTFSDSVFKIGRKKGIFKKIIGIIYKKYIIFLLKVLTNKYFCDNITVMEQVLVIRSQREPQGAENADDTPRRIPPIRVANHGKI